MAFEIKGLKDWQDRLAQAQPLQTMETALAAAADRLADAVRDGLSQAPGSAHDKPWVRTGALRDSIAAQSDGLQAVVGSSDKAAAPQELGTTHLPPRPFLAPAAAAQAEILAQSIGEAVATALGAKSGGRSDAGKR